MQGVNQEQPCADVVTGSREQQHLQHQYQQQDMQQQQQVEHPHPECKLALVDNGVPSQSAPTWHVPERPFPSSIWVGDHHIFL